ncbi:MAG: universal stress protein [Chloroflexota bacterium]
MDYSILLPVANKEHAAELGRLGSLLAKEHDGEVLALNVIKVPPTLQLSDGRYFLKERRPIIEQVIEQAKAVDVPVHTMLRLGRSVSEAIIKTAGENSSDLILFGWPGESGSNDRLFGSVIRTAWSPTPADIVVIRSRPFDKLHRILVPVAGGPNGRLALATAIALARNTQEETEIVLLYVTPPGTDPQRANALAKNAFRRANGNLGYAQIERHVVTAESPLDGILTEAQETDMVVIGASEERGFRNLLLGNVAQQVAEQASARYSLCGGAVRWSSRCCGKRS